MWFCCCCLLSFSSLLHLLLLFLTLLLPASPDFRPPLEVDFKTMSSMDVSMDGISLTQLFRNFMEKDFVKGSKTAKAFEILLQDAEVQEYLSGEENVFVGVKQLKKMAVGDLLHSIVPCLFLSFFFVFFFRQLHRCALGFSLAISRVGWWL